MNMIKPCPFCGNDIQKQFDYDNFDTIYPVGKSDLYQIVCGEWYGGCSATMLGSSVEDCINKWNKRKKESYE